MPGTPLADPALLIDPTLGAAESAVANANANAGRAAVGDALRVLALVQSIALLAFLLVASRSAEPGALGAGVALGLAVCILVLAALHRAPDRAARIAIDVEANPGIDALKDRLASEAESRRRLEAALLASEKACLEKARQVAMIGHELRQPIQALGLFVAALKAESMPDRTGFLVERLGCALDGLDGLLDRLLDLSRLEAGRVRIEPAAIPADQLAAVLDARFAATAALRGISFRIRLTPGLVVCSDRQALVEILGNLLSNALTHTSQGRVVLLFKGSGDRARIQVWDSGIGIAPRDQQRIFDDFVQLDNRPTARASGLGLGLAIVRRLVALLGHTIELRSRPGSGSVFEIALPRIMLSTREAPGLTRSLP